MAQGIDISMIGDKAVERMLHRLPLAAQDKAIKPAVKKAVAFLKPEVIRRIPRDTGDYARVMAQQKIVSSTNRGLFLSGLPFPTREELDIDPNDEFFWPAALEYGHAAPGGAQRSSSGKLVSSRRKAGGAKAVPPRPHLRPAIDENRERVYSIIARVLRDKIPKIAAKLGK